MAEVDEFELFRARSYGVESELKQQRASTVRVSGSRRPDSSRPRERLSEKSHRRRGPADTTTPLTEPQVTTLTEAEQRRQPTAAERKASFKSSPKRRQVFDENVPGDALKAEITRTDEFEGEKTTGVGVHRRSEADSIKRRFNDSSCESMTPTHSLSTSPDYRQRRGSDRHQVRQQPPAEIAHTEEVTLSVRDDDDDDDNNEDDGETCRVYRMRSFYTKSGNVINCGDSVRLQRDGSGGHSAGAHPAARRTWAGAGRTAQTEASRLVTVTDVLGDENAADEAERISGFVDKTSRSGRSGAGGSRAYPSSGEPRDRMRDELGDARRPETSTRLDLLTVDRKSTAVGKRRSFGGNEDAEQSAEGSRSGGGNGAGSSSSYRVLVIGSQGVGKTTLTQQIMTSEYLANKDSFTEDDSGDQTPITVQLDDEEFQMHFIEIAVAEMNNLKGRNGPAADAHLVVYSITDRNSFQFAQTCLQDLRPAKRHNVVILVGNKQDIVRNRMISEEAGKHLATKRHCKFIEVSALLNHKMDELLVGTLRQIRMRKTGTSPGPPMTSTAACQAASNHHPPHPRQQQHHQQHHRPRQSTDHDPVNDETATLAGFGCLQRAAMSVFDKLFQRTVVRSTSCDDLFKP